MAFLACYAHVSPSEFERMEHSTTEAFASEVSEIVKAEHKLTNERLKAILESIGRSR